MNAAAPLVSVGLPTYNGARYLAQSLDSLLAQSYERIEILISDNASTDDTEAIARAYVARDARVRYERMATNQGAIANFNRVLSDSSGDLFMFASDHDLWHPSFISLGVDALVRDPATVLSYPGTMLMDENGVELGVMDDRLELVHARTLDRYLQLIWHLDVCNMVYGVGRRAAFRKAGGFTDVYPPDFLFLARMVLQGKIINLPDVMFSRRQTHPQEGVEEQTNRVLKALDPSSADERAERPHAGLYRRLRNAHLRAVMRSDMSIKDKAIAMVATVQCHQRRFGVTSPLQSLASRLVREAPGIGAMRRRLGDPNRR